MKNNLVRVITARIVLGGLAFISIAANAYDETTHQTLTTLAINRSALVVDPGLLSDFGLPGSSSGLYPNFDGYPPHAISPTNPVVSAVWGAWEEDNVFSGLSSGIHQISFNHFFDPQWALGAGRPLSLLNVDIGHTSPSWILEESIPGSPATDRGPYSDQFYSFAKAQQQLYVALTSASATARLTAFGMVFQSLGHIVHHIQDMAQPQHVRNEPHIHGTGAFFDSSAGWYEKYTTSVINPSLATLATSVWGIYPIPGFSSVSRYWSSYDSHSKVGMAEFTSRNYLTFSSGLNYNPANGSFRAADKSQFPLPNGAGLSLSTQSVTETDLETGISYSANLNYAIGTVSDEFGGAQYGGRKLAAESALQQLISQSLGTSRYFTGGEQHVWDDGYPILLPRAIAFSAGLINHFFRGRIGFSRVSGTTWSLSNPTAFPMNGTYSIYAEDSAGNRTPLPGAVFTANIAPGGSQNVVFAEPANSPVKLIAAFSGTVGTEANRVAGKVISYVAPAQPPASPPPPACLGPFKYAGNVGTSSGTGTFTFLGTTGLNYRDYVMQMGSTAGNILYNGYSTVAYQSSGMIVYANNSSKTYLGSASFTAWGTAFGPYPTGFSGVISGFNPSGQASVSIILRLYSTGTVPSSSELTVGLSCPGGTVPDLTKGSATFFVDGATNGCKSEFDFQIDGGSVKTIASQSAGLSMPLTLGAHSVRVSALRTSGFCSGYNLSWGVIKYQNNQVVQRIDPGIPGTQTIIVR